MDVHCIFRGSVLSNQHLRYPPSRNEPSQNSGDLSAWKTPFPINFENNQETHSNEENIHSLYHHVWNFVV